MFDFVTFFQPRHFEGAPFYTAWLFLHALFRSIAICHTGNIKKKQLFQHNLRYKGQ